MYPTTAFEHLGEVFTPAVAVPADHPMVEARPDLFTDTKPSKPTKPAPTSKPRTTTLKESTQ